MRKYKSQKIERSLQMHTYELRRLGEKYIPNFVGVFALDQLPRRLVAPSNFIVNTHTHNLPGQHWIAVSYKTGGIVYAFDPLGLYYPYLLRKYLSELPNRPKIHYNNVPYQSITERNCGQYCIAWLLYINGGGGGGDVKTRRRRRRHVHTTSSSSSLHRL